MRNVPATAAQQREAAWWLTRWISGSARDPDWDDTWTTMDMAAGLRLVGQMVGNELSVGKPLWRYLMLPGLAAEELGRTHRLQPHQYLHQSFSGRREVALHEGPEIVGVIKRGHVGVIVCARPDPSLVAFGMRDLQRSKNRHIQEALKSLDNWHDQDEVLVQIAEPLPLSSVALVPRGRCAGAEPEMEPRKPSRSRPS